MPEGAGVGAAAVVKVGGSLYDLPDLGQRLRAWLSRLTETFVVIVPGGGRMTDAIRSMDKIHGIGEEAAHWLALRALTLNAHWLRQLLPGSVVCGAVASPQAAGCVILDAFAFAQEDESRPGALPHCWEATSDALAARVAVVAGIPRLYLLKSVSIPAGIDWTEASRRGFVDAVLPEIIKRVQQLRVESVNFRQWQPG
jgi:aspartokinase-like uncharacterized kinase